MTDTEPRVDERTQEQKDRAINVVEFLIRNECLDQNTFARQVNACQTTYCLAGATVVLNGDTLTWSTKYDDDRAQASMCITIDEHREMDIAERAAELLGLTSHQKYWLFYDADTLADIQLGFMRIAAGRL